MTGSSTAIDDTFNLAGKLLACVHETLAATVGGAPARACVVGGAEIAWDECDCGGQLTVSMLRTYPSDSFPILKQTGPFNRCDAKLTVAEYVITILRCAPGSDDAGAPPTCDALTSAGRVDHEDRWAIRRGVACCRENDAPESASFWLVQEQLAIGAMGFCQGSELHLFVGFPNCDPCTGGTG